MLLYCLLIFFIFPANLFTQEIEKKPSENLVIQKPTLPELGELKLKFMTEDLSADELFRLASFYMSEKSYHKAANIYDNFLQISSDSSDYLSRKPLAYYNRALALYALNLHDSALEEFNYAYFFNNQLVDALRMMGTIYYLKNNKINSLKYWNQYLTQNTVPSLERTAIEQAVTLLSSPDFEFPKKAIEEESATPPIPDQSWPFLNPDIIPNPDSTYNKKRLI